MVSAISVFPPLPGGLGQGAAYGCTNRFAARGRRVNLVPGAVGGVFSAPCSLRAHSPSGRPVVSPNQPPHLSLCLIGQCPPDRAEGHGTLSYALALPCQMPQDCGQEPDTETRQCVPSSSPLPPVPPLLPAKAPTLSAARWVPALQAARPWRPAATWLARLRPAALPAWSATTSRRSSAADLTPGPRAGKEGAPSPTAPRPISMQRRPKHRLRAAFVVAQQRPKARKTKGQTCSTRS